MEHRGLPEYEAAGDSVLCLAQSLAERAAGQLPVQAGAELDEGGVQFSIVLRRRGHVLGRHRGATEAVAPAVQRVAQDLEVGIGVLADALSAFAGVDAGQARLSVFSASNTSAAGTVYPILAVSLLPQPVDVPGVGMLGIDLGMAVMLPPVVLPAGRESVDVGVAIPTSRVLSGTALLAQAVVQRMGTWRLTNVERVLLVH